MNCRKYPGADCDTDHQLLMVTVKVRLSKFPSGHHRTTLLSYIFVTAHVDNRKNLSNSNISSTCSHNMVNVSPPTGEIGSGVWVTPANFNEFRVLASLLHRRRSVEVNQTLHDVWPSPGLVHCIHFWGLLSLTEFCQSV